MYTSKLLGGVTQEVVMSCETEILTQKRLISVVNAELVSAGLQPINKVARDENNAVTGIHNLNSLRTIQLGYIEYVPGLGEIFYLKLKG